MTYENGEIVTIDSNYKTFVRAGRSERRALVKTLAEKGIETIRWKLVSSRHVSIQVRAQNEAVQYCVKDYRRRNPSAKIKISGGKRPLASEDY